MTELRFPCPENCAGTTSTIAASNINRKREREDLEGMKRYAGLLRARLYSDLNSEETQKCVEDKDSLDDRA